MATIQDIKQRAQQVKDATQIGENTANRVGGVLVDMADHLEQDENQLSSLYPADSTPTPNSVKPVQSGGVLNSVIRDGSAFDLSAHTGGSYASLSAALTAMSGLPAAYKKGGMSIKFIQSSDNKYVQYMLTSYEWRTAVSDWQKMNLEEQVGEESSTVDSSDGFPYKRRHKLSSYVESATGTRYTIGLNIPKGTAIKVKSTYSPGIYISGYDSFNACCVGPSDALQRYHSSYTTNEVVGIANVDQVFNIKWKNSDDSAITDAQIEQMLESLTVEVVIPGTGLIGEVEELQSQVDELGGQVDELGEKESSMKSDIDRLNAITSAFQMGYPNASGVFTTFGNFGKHLIFPVKAGDVVRIEEGSHYTFICYLKTYDSPVAGKTVDYSSVEGYTDRILIVANEEYEGVVPADANFIAVAYGNDAFHDLDVQLVSIAGRVVCLRDSINAEIDSINAEIDSINAEIDSINAEIGTPATPITDIADADYERRHLVSKSAESATGNRYTFGFDVKAGDTLEVQSSYSPGIGVTIFDTFNNGCVGSSNPGMGKLQEITGGYTTSKVTATCNYDGVLIIKFKKSDESAITDAEMAEMKASITTLNLTKQGTGLCGDVEELQSQVEEINNTTSRTNLQQIENRKILYIGQLVQKSVNGNTFTDSTTIVTQKCAIAVPHYDVKVDIKLPAGYCVGFKTAYSTIGWSLTWVRDSGWLTNGGSYTFDGHNGQIYRVYFGKNNGADTLDVATIQGLLNSGAIQLTYFSADGSVITRNSHTEYYVKGLMRKFTGTLANDDSLHKMPVFTHLSDIHGDAVRYENFVQYSDFLEADAALVSGDLVPMCGAQDYTDYIDDVADKYNVMVLPCMGNHDARSNTSKQSQNAVLSHSISKWSLQTPAGEDYPTFYYKDIPSQSIRIIALNLYCAGQKNTNDWRLTQEQITWFVDTLENTPTGYGVIVMMHSPETTTNKDSNYGKFYQTYENGTISYNNAYLPIRKIVDAFISKTTFSGTFDEEITGSVTETITISADFTSVDSSTEFICYVTGHRHKDCIGYVNGATNMQLMCNIALGFSLYGDSNYHYYAEEVDVPRGGKGFVQDLMNVYVVDRATGNLRIARIGSNMNQNFEMRDYMTIPYKAS